jgi:hypothetical protein
MRSERRTCALGTSQRDVRTCLSSSIVFRVVRVFRGYLPGSDATAIDLKAENENCFYVQEDELYFLLDF